MISYTSLLSWALGLLAIAQSSATAKAREVLTHLLDDGKITAEELEEAVLAIADAALPFDAILPQLEDLTDDLLEQALAWIEEQISDMLHRDSEELEARAEKLLDRAVELDAKADELQAAGHPNRAARKLAKSLRKLARGERLEDLAAERADEEAAD